ncbi:helix-turn-helix domain-containing protein [uncultured Shimia sp.]|uniref:MerR family transcriptional regulator n=1 Tax=uncultured Shimia sp. TaxID=573152 RepID=UPI002606A973|nr:helix-turn-helix domain-containing protein [uncultured Shimia sp.]
MFSIGQLSTRTGVKVPTIRYYEEIGLLPAPERTGGNQRRYGVEGLQRLGFVKHARDLGFSIEAITKLLELQDHPDCTCAEAGDLAQAQLLAVQSKIARLNRLQAELQRLVAGCHGDGTTGECYVMASLADHDLCLDEH